MSLTVTSLIDTFETKLKEYNKKDAVYTNGDRPQHPMAVFYLGNSGKKHSLLLDELGQLWPISFRSAFRFFSVDLNIGCGNYDFSFFTDSWNIVETSVVERSLLELFDGDNVLDSRALCLYFILSSDDVNSLDTCDEYMGMVENLIADVGKFVASELKPMLIILMNERGTEQQKKVKLLKRYFSDRVLNCCKSVIAISNLTDAVTYSDDAVLMRLVSLSIVLSNWKNNYVPKHFCKEGVKVVGYNIVEKESKKISSVLVRNLVEDFQKKINEENDDNNGISVNLNAILSAMGVKYGDRYLFPDYLIPNEIWDKLNNFNHDREKFPRRNMEEFPHSLSLNDFDYMTMGAVKGYLYDLYLELRVRMLTSSGWKKISEEKIREQLSFLQFLDIYNRWDELNLKQHFFNGKFDHNTFFDVIPQEIKSDGNLYQGFKNALVWLISSDSEVLTVYFDFIKSICKKCIDFEEERREFLQSRNAVEIIQDRAFKEYYEEKTSQYFKNNIDYREKLLKLVFTENIEEMKCLWMDLMDSVLEANSNLLKQSYDEELRNRIAEGDPEETVNIIHQKINDRKLYFRIPGMSHDPLFTTIVMDTDKTFCNDLRERLKNMNSLFFYDTDLSDAAEVFELYPVDPILLIGDDDNEI